MREQTGHASQPDRPRRRSAGGTSPRDCLRPLGRGLLVAGAAAMLGTIGSASATQAAAPGPAANAVPAAQERVATGSWAATLVNAPAADAGAEPAPGVITGLAANGIPNVALNAYRVAAARIDNAMPSCGLDWSLLAGIGRVESNHGRFGGAVLNPDGTSTPRIIGPALDGVRFGYVPDTDRGRWDGDARFDHAVGPMQFIPSTWRAYAVDADGGDAPDPFDIDDAALAAAHYLCVAGGDLATTGGQRRAVLAYNHSDSYVAEVLALARAYAAGIPVSGLPMVGDTTGPVPAPSGDWAAPAAPGPAIGAADTTPSDPAGTARPGPQPSPEAAGETAGQPASGASAPGGTSAGPGATAQPATTGPSAAPAPPRARPATSGSPSATAPASSAPTQPAPATGTPTPASPSAPGPLPLPTAVPVSCALPLQPDCPAG